MGYRGGGDLWERRFGFNVKKNVLIRVVSFLILEMLSIGSMLFVVGILG